MARERAELDAAAASSRARVAPRSWLFFLPIATVLGAASVGISYIYPSSASLEVSSTIHIASAALTTFIVLVIVLSTGRAALTARPVREVARWMVISEAVRNLAASSVLLSVGLGVMTVVGTGDLSGSFLLAIVIISMFVAGARGLLLLYRETYLDFTLPPSERADYLADVAARPRPRKVIERLFPIGRPDRLRFPAIEAALVLFPIPSLLGWGATELGLPGLVVQCTAGLGLALAVAAWSYFRLAGGISRLRHRDGGPRALRPRV